MGSSFQQPGTVKENVLESDFEPLCEASLTRGSQTSGGDVNS